MDGEQKIRDVLVKFEEIIEIIPIISTSWRT